MIFSKVNGMSLSLQGKKTISVLVSDTNRVPFFEARKAAQMEALFEVIVTLL